MRKIVQSIVVLCAAIVMLASCNDDQKAAVLAPMNGSWQCESVSGGALGGAFGTPALNTEAFKLFNVVYGGVVGSGVYGRTGSGDIAADASSISGMLGDSNLTESWTNLFSYGTFTYSGNSSSGTITMTSTDGAYIQTYQYNIYEDGADTKMELIQDATPAGTPAVVGQVTSILGALFGGNSSPSLVQIKYTYKKVNVFSNLNN